MGLGVVVCLAAPPSAPAAESEPGPVPAIAHRVVSMNPSLTAILLALGARDTLVGVDDFSARQQPTVAALPHVGGLYSPSLEAVLALRPDLVVLVPSAEQRDFRARLADAGIDVLALDPTSFGEVMKSILTLGARVGREEAARARVAAIRRARRQVERATRNLPHPRTVLVLQRDPLFVVGRGSFLDAMLDAVGARNLGHRFSRPYPEVSLEWLVKAQPEVILDSAPGPENAQAFWSRWPSLPAVAHHRVVAIPPGRVTLPGPYLDRALRTLARAVHGRDVLARRALAGAR